MPLAEEGWAAAELAAEDWEEEDMDSKHLDSVECPLLCQPLGCPSRINADIVEHY